MKETQSQSGLAPDFQVLRRLRKLTRKIIRVLTNKNMNKMKMTMPKKLLEEHYCGVGDEDWNEEFDYEI